MKKSKIQKANERIVRNHNRLARGILGNALSSSERRTIARAMRKVARHQSGDEPTQRDDVDWYGVKMGFCVCSQPTEKAARAHAKQTGGQAFVVKNGKRHYL